MEVLFTLLAERYERGSLLLTSNLPFSKWDGIFKDPMTTAATIFFKFLFVVDAERSRYIRYLDRPL